MKLVFKLSIFLITIGVFAQDRTLINGKVTVPMGEDPQGISIVNTSAQSAAVSNETGNFRIRAAKGDTIHFQALQYEDFSVLVDQGVIDNRKLNVFISEAINELPEVVVRPYDLSGNVEVDVRIIPVSETDLPTQTAAEINPYDRTMRPDSLVSPANAAMREEMIYSGTEFANIFRNIFTSRDVVTEMNRTEDIDEQVMLLYDDDFFQEHLNISEENIHEFIFFAEDNGLSPEMLEEENEMQLIEFLVAQSQRYKQRKAQSDR